MWTAIRAGALAALALTVATSSGFAQTLGIGTSPQGTMTYSLGSGLARVLGASAGLRAMVQPNGGTGVMIPLVNTGELDIGFANAAEVAEAYSGSGSFNGRAQPDLRLVARLFPAAIGVFVRADSSMRTMADLKGKSVTSGYSSTPILQTVLEAMLANAGLSTADVRPVMVPSLPRGVEDFVSGKADAGFFAVGGAKVSEADAAVNGVRFLALSDEPEAVARMQKVLPGSYVINAQPAPGLAGIAQPTKTIGYDYLVFTGTKLPADTVYRILKAIAENKDALAGSAPPYKDLELGRLGAGVGAPYHEGALRYFKEKNMAVTQ